MKIFVGGQLAHHNHRFERDYPNVEFEFATLSENAARWVSRARRCDIVILDQARCNHDITDQMKKGDVHYYMVNMKAQIHQLIQEILKRGQVSHSYARSAGSQSAAFQAAPTSDDGQRDLSAWLAEVIAGNSERGPAATGSET